MVVSDQDTPHLVSVVGPVVAETSATREAQTGVHPLPCEAAMMAGSWTDDPLGGGLVLLLSVVWAVCAIARAVVRDDD